jgi:uncharacterized membrane protein YtjA (UPF0391 family)
VPTAGQKCRVVHGTRLARDWLERRSCTSADDGHGGGKTNMLQWAIIFFVIALVAALLGQRGVAGLSAQIGYLFVGVAVIFLLVALLTGRGAPVP